MNFVREHPILTGSGIIAVIVLIFVLRRSGGSGTQVISSGPSEALQAAGLQANVAQQQMQTAANVQLSGLNAAVAAHELDAQTQLKIAEDQKQIALAQILTGGQVDLAKTDAATSIAQAQIKGQTDQTQAVVSGQVSVAGIQAGVQQHQFDVALQAQKDIDKTQLQTTALTTSAATDVATVNATAAQKIAETQGATATNLATIQGGVMTHGIDTQAAVYNNLITTQGSVATTQLNTQDTIDQQVFDLLRSGQINKGGEGGQNQVAVLDTLFGNYTGSATASAGAATQGVAGAGMITGIVGSIAKGFTSLFA